MRFAFGIVVSQIQIKGEVKWKSRKCVCWAPVDGSGIAQVCAQAGYEVTMRDIEQRFIDGGMNHDQEKSQPRSRKR